jgi:L,D-transpeptidase catalytic domain/PKD domain/Putative peptidoglycan binding domain
VRGAIVLLAGLALAASANAAPPAVTAAASPAAGPAPLRVTLTATGDAASYNWDLGDGATASGQVVTHTYAAGRFVATVTATGSTGEVAQAQVAVTVSRRTLLLGAPARADHGDAGTLTGSLRPGLRGASIRIYRGSTYVTSTRTRADGSFRARILFRSPGPYHARWGTLRSAPRTVVLQPRLHATLPAVVPIGGTLRLTPRLEPAGAGTLRVRVLRGRKLVASKAGALPTGIVGALRVEVSTAPRPGFAAVRRVLTTQVVHPSLARGSRGPSVLALERRLAELRYALPRVDALYGHDTFEAVLAFQKVHGLPRTGTVEPWLWRRLATAEVPRPQRGGDYIEVNKTRQTLFVVRGGEVTKIVHVSTGLTGNTPLGTWQVYRKVPGWDWVLWYPLYFLRGFAIHGYPSVPAYPASHGCVRVPMWIAPSLFDAHGFGTTVSIHA